MGLGLAKTRVWARGSHDALPQMAWAREERSTGFGTVVVRGEAA